LGGMITERRNPSSFWHGLGGKTKRLMNKETKGREEKKGKEGKVSNGKKRAKKQTQGRQKSLVSVEHRKSTVQKQ